jgi:hypothetical protein
VIIAYQTQAHTRVHSDKAAEAEALAARANYSVDAYVAALDCSIASKELSRSLTVASRFVDVRVLLGIASSCATPRW